MLAARPDDLFLGCKAGPQHRVIRNRRNEKLYRATHHAPVVERCRSKNSALLQGSYAQGQDEFSGVAVKSYARQASIDRLANGHPSVSPRHVCKMYSTAALSETT